MYIRSCGCRWYGAEGLVTSDGLAGQPDGTGEAAHVVALRGVVWRSADAQVFRLWQDLARFWPAPFAADATERTASLVAHTGQSPHSKLSRSLRHGLKL